MNKNIQDLIIVLKDGRKLPCSMEVDQSPKDYDVELQQWAEDDYDQIDRIDPWEGVKAIRLKDGTVIHCNALYINRNESVEEIGSYKEACDGLDNLGIEDGYFELLQTEDIECLD